MQWHKFLAVAAFAAAGVVHNAQAALPTYGYVTGTFVSGSNKLEPLDQQGAFLHYRFKIQAAPGVQYEAVIDVKNGHLYPFPQRVLSIADPGQFPAIFSSSNGYHPISMTSSGGNPSQGALDYIRHPGLLQSMDQPWTWLKASPTLDPNIFQLPEWDALFVGVQKIYAFGQPYTTGNGVHVVHQNQGDKKEKFYGSNGMYQDGAVIFEYANGERKVLMTRFDDQPNDPGQADFSWDYDPDGSGPLRTGVARTPTVLNLRCDQTTADMSGRCVFGPYGASQIEAETLVQSRYQPAVFLDESTDVIVWLTGKKAAPVRTARVAAPSQTMTIAGATYSKGYVRTYKSAQFTANYYVSMLRNPDWAPIDVTIRFVQ